MASLRGENLSLSNQLNNCHNTINELQNDKVGQSRQVALLEQRISKLKRDITKYQKGDLGAQLKTIEHERDVLLDYIQNDMKKNSSTLQKLNQIETELKRKSDELDDNNNKIREYENLLKQDEEKINKSMAEISLLQSKNLSLENSKEGWDAQHHHIISQLDRKKLESDELSKMQMALLMQMKSKDELLQQSINEINNLKSILNTNDGKFITLNAELDNLRSKVPTLEVDLAAAKEQILLLKPYVSGMEPEINKLRTEKVEKETQLKEALAELVDLRPINELLVALNKEILESIKSFALSQVDNNDDESKSIDNNEILLTQMHATWTGLPSLRQLSSPLYERIRRISQDLHRKELQCKDMDMKIASTKKDFESKERMYEDEINRLASGLEAMNRQIDEYKLKLAETEDDLMRTRSAKVTLDQLRLTLLSCPGGIESFFAASTYGATVDSLLASSINNGTISLSQRMTEDDVKQVPDQYLPEIVGRALMHNSNAVVNLQEIKCQLQLTQEQLETLKAEHSSVLRENESVRYEDDNLRKRLVQCETTFAENEEILRADLEVAAELAEKQNALTLALENKMENLKREKQMKSAQVTSLQQREESIRMRLWNTLLEIGRRARVDPRTLPPESTRLNELVQYITDFLGRLVQTNSLLAAKIQFPNQINADSVQYNNLPQAPPSLGRPSFSEKLSESDFTFAHSDTSGMDDIFSPSPLSKTAPIPSTSSTTNNSKVKTAISGRTHVPITSSRNVSFTSNTPIRKTSSSSTTTAPRSKSPVGDKKISPATKLKNKLKEAQLTLSSMRE